MTLDFQIPDDEHSKSATGSRAFLETIAGKIERGEQLASDEILFAAGACRAAAKQIPLKQKRKKGAAPKYDASLAAIQYASGQYTLEKLAEMHGVTVDALKKALKKNDRLKTARSLMPSPTKPKR